MKPGKERPASSCSVIQGLRSGAPPKKSLKAKPSVSRESFPRGRGLCLSRFLRSQSVASALDLPLGTTPRGLFHPSTSVAERNRKAEKKRRQRITGSLHSQGSISSWFANEN